MPVIGVSVSRDENFVDPIVAVRANAPIAPRWTATGYLDAGGFGAGSDLTDQILATVTCEVNLVVSGL